MIYLSSALMITLFFIVWFTLCVKRENYGLVDIAWGLGMALIALFLLLGYRPNVYVSTALIFIVVWGLRLGLYLGKRNWNNPEDYRYVNLRKRWGTKKPRLKAFMNVFVLQGVLLYIMMFNSMYITTLNPQPIKLIYVFGIGVSIFGLLFEVIGDYQLKQFKQNPNNKGKLMTQGLWATTRHPNYFGEVTFWWGIFFITLQGLGSLVGLISPLLITILINKVSGIPLLERKYQDNESYLEYAEKTPRMIPFIGTKKMRK